MPIYAYKCESCGHTKDVLQKMSDAPLTDCPQCGAAAFKKQVTAAGFQLKGSGWYVTDFRGGSSTGAPAPSGQGADAGSAKSGDAAASTTSSAPATATPAAAAPAAASSPAPASSTSSAGKGSS
ncbi:MAG: FmdB family zinc ribbon protein [Pseudomonadota bacterium]